MAIVDGGGRLISPEAIDMLRRFSHGIDDLVLAIAQQVAEQRPGAEEVAAIDVSNALEILRKVANSAISSKDVPDQEKLAAQTLLHYLNVVSHPK